jgi:hypothetical protein
MVPLLADLSLERAKYSGYEARRSSQNARSPLDAFVDIGYIRWELAVWQF